MGVGGWEGVLDRKIEDVWRQSCRQMCRYCAVNDILGAVRLCCCSDEEARWAAFVEVVDVRERAYS